jgi:U4/U6.U5 tri-snRNP-associated protein 2
MQEISVESKKRFSIGQRQECTNLLVWLLAILNRDLRKSKKTSPIYEPFQVSLAKYFVLYFYLLFQGIVRVTSLTKGLVDSFDEQQLLRKNNNDLKSGAVTVEGSGDGWVESFADIPFNFLSVDIPPCPLFRDSHGGLVIPQIPLFQVLRKFDGNTWTDHVTKDEHVRKQYRIQTLPQYLILHLVRFTKNNFSLEKNSTIVTFPVKNLEMRDFLFQDEGDMSSTERLSQQKDIDSCPNVDDVQNMEVNDIRTLIKRLGSELHLLQLHNCDACKGSEISQLEGLRLIATNVINRVQLFASTKYDLLVNICHDSTQAAQSVTVGDLNMNLNSTSGQQKKGSKSRNVTAAAGNNVLNSGAFKVHLHNKATDQWFEIQDLHVTETMPQLVGW